MHKEKNKMFACLSLSTLPWYIISDVQAAKYPGEILDEIKKLNVFEYCPWENTR